MFVYNNFESGQNKSKTYSYITTMKVVRTRVKRVRIIITTVKVVRTRAKLVRIYSVIENATLSLLPWTLVTNFISKETIFCSLYQQKISRLPTTVSTPKAHMEMEDLYAKHSR